MPEQTSEAGGQTDPAERPADSAGPVDPAGPSVRPSPAEPAGRTPSAAPSQPPPTSRWSGAARLCRVTARANWLFLIVFGLGAVGRLLTMIAFPPAMMYVDSYGYLANSVALDPQSMDPLGYAVFLRFMLEHGHLGMIALVQHLFGLGMGLCVYVILRRRNVPKALAVLASAPVLLDAYQ